MPVLTNSRHEAFAQNRFSGMSVMDAYRAAGFVGQSPQVASSVSRHPDVKARILELHNAAATVIAYERLDAIRDLVTIINAKPSEATPDHPLCEARTGRQGKYHRFPSKLRAMARLVKIMGWDEPRPEDEDDEPQPDPIKELLIRIRSKGQPPKHNPDSADEWDPNGAPVDPSAPLSPKQETYAQARFQGLGVQEAYEMAGFTGDPSRRAWRISRHPAVKARLAALRKAAEDALPCRRHEIVNHLITIVQASPDEAGPDHSLCEKRMGHDGPYYRFPCKLAAFTLLVKLMRWHEPPKMEINLPGAEMDPVERMLARIRSRP